MSDSDSRPAVTAAPNTGLARDVANARESVLAVRREIAAEVEHLAGMLRQADRLLSEVDAIGQNAPAPAAPGGQPERCKTCEGRCFVMRGFEAGLSGGGVSQQRCVVCRGKGVITESPAPSPAPSVERQALARIVEAYDHDGMMDVATRIEDARAALERTSRAARPLAEGQPAEKPCPVCDRCSKPIVTDATDICQCPPPAEEGRS